ncbi:hypothetical protein K438DRAFT_1764736 [Mycena galopus ATCC 62051]|nr:hypothetical protein K438DRAFT_1764736 [Mycena galopus ATCC 62051]
MSQLANASLDNSPATVYASREYHGYTGTQYALPTNDAERRRFLGFGHDTICRSSGYISVELTPHPAFSHHLPPDNVVVQAGSVTSLPADWTNRFTFVHQRLLVIALQISEWPQSLAEIYRVLRPGYLDMPAMLEKPGFVDIKAEGWMLRLGKWGGEDEIASAINHATMFRGFKSPVLQAGLRGMGLAKEWDEIPGTQIEFVTFGHENLKIKISTWFHQW